MDDTEITGAEAPRASLPPPAPPAYPKPPKSPGVALVLSGFFPGIGQVYNGQPAKALVFFFSFVGSIYGAAEANPLPFALLIPFVYFFNIVDAYRSAALINARYAGQGTLPEEDTTESPAWGGTLIAIGFLLLAHNLNWIDLARLERFWPAVLIVAGGYLLWNSLQNRKETSSGGSL